MSMSSSSRYLLRQRADFHPRHKKATLLPLIAPGTELDILSILQDSVEDGSGFVDLRAGVDDTIRLTHIEYRKNEKLIVGLVRRRDNDLSTQIFEHSETKKLREPRRSAQEAPASSCHFFISVPPELGSSTCHRAILEEVHTIGRSYVQLLLKSIISKRVYEFDDKEPKEPKETYTVFSLKGAETESVRKALNNYGMNYIELQRAPDLSGMDDDSVVAHPLVLKLTVRTEHKSRIALLEKMRKWGVAHGWPDMRVQVGSGDDKTRVVRIQRQADAADTLFVKAEYVTTESPMKACSDVINDELVKHAARILKDNEWK